ncbi:MAG TPA: OmpH family outer membrane protein [Bryobacteraceae bacterium]|jgi:outer membrane protein|nr:OmpH family outer membrane protein [Bryobacteraceae bacterium]
MGFKLQGKKKVLAMLLVTGLGASISGAQEAPIKIAVINVQQALVTTKDGKKALEDLKARVAPKQKEFDARQQEILHLQDELAKGSNLLSDEKKQQLAQDIDLQKKKLERDTQDAQDDVQNRQQGVLQALGQKLMAVVTKYAKENKYTLVVESGSGASQVIYSADNIDITQPVVALYDQTYSSPGK